MEESIWIRILRVLDTQMETPELYGWFHLMSFAVVFAATLILCKLHRKGYGMLPLLWSKKII